MGARTSRMRSVAPPASRRALRGTVPLTGCDIAGLSLLSGAQAAAAVAGHARQHPRQHVAAHQRAAEARGGPARGRWPDSAPDSIPRCTRTARELERVSGESEGIQRSLASLESRIGSVEANTHSSLGTLQALHRVKSRMGSVRACLREAANWSRLVREADAVFASNDVAAIARHLASMRHSVRVLAATPGHDARAGTFSQLYERLEDALRGPLRVAVAASDPGAGRFPPPSPAASPPPLTLVSSATQLLRAPLPTPTPSWAAWTAWCSARPAFEPSSCWPIGIRSTTTSAWAPGSAPSARASAAPCGRKPSFSGPCLLLPRTATPPASALTTLPPPRLCVRSGALLLWRMRPSFPSSVPCRGAWTRLPLWRRWRRWRGQLRRSQRECWTRWAPTVRAAG